MKSQANKSFVQFTNHQEALRALRSVEAVLGNRFIKVFWSTNPSEAQATTGPSAPPQSFQQPFTPISRAHSFPPLSATFNDPNKEEVKPKSMMPAPRPPAINIEAEVFSPPFS